MKKSFAAVLFFCSVFFAGGAFGITRHLETRCLDCHNRLPFDKSRLSFNEGSGAVCSRCHVNHHGVNEKNSHPVNVTPSMAIPKDMPVDIKGNMTCITCHTFHIGHNRRDGAYEFFLRRLKGITFCHSCHKKPLFRPAI